MLYAFSTTNGSRDMAVSDLKLKKIITRVYVASTDEEARRVYDALNPFVRGHKALTKRVSEHFALQKPRR